MPDDDSIDPATNDLATKLDQLVDNHIREWNSPLANVVGVLICAVVERIVEHVYEEDDDEDPLGLNGDGE